MNGGHDLGGKHGLGPIAPEPENEEPRFHAKWEERVFALTLAAGFLGKWNIDMSRHARERQHPADYLKNSYYENWLAGLETLLVEHELLSVNELDSGKVTSKSGPNDLRLLKEDEVALTLAKGGPSSMPGVMQPAFALGQEVRVIEDNPLGHTRVPGYVRGKRGRIHTYHGVHVFADRSANGQREGQPLYTVEFQATTLWGKQGDSSQRVYLDLWEPHLRRI